MNILPNGKVIDAKSLGDIVRQQRKLQGATQVEFASLCGVGVRFISDLENGKPTMEMGKVIQVLDSLGLSLIVQPRGWTHADLNDEKVGAES